MRVKHISLIHIVNKSSKFNIGIVIVGYSLFIIIIIIIYNNNELN